MLQVPEVGLPGIARRPSERPSLENGRPEEIIEEDIQELDFTPATFETVDVASELGSGKRFLSVAKSVAEAFKNAPVTRLGLAEEHEKSQWQLLKSCSSAHWDEAAVSATLIDKVRQDYQHGRGEGAGEAGAQPYRARQVPSHLQHAFAIFQNRSSECVSKLLNLKDLDLRSAQSGTGAAQEAFDGAVQALDRLQKACQDIVGKAHDEPDLARLALQALFSAGKLFQKYFDPSKAEIPAGLYEHFLYTKNAGLHAVSIGRSASHNTRDPSTSHQRAQAVSLAGRVPEAIQNLKRGRYDAATVAEAIEDAESCLEQLRELSMESAIQDDWPLVAHLGDGIRALRKGLSELEDIQTSFKPNRLARASIQSAAAELSHAMEGLGQRPGARAVAAASGLGASPTGRGLYNSQLSRTLQSLRALKKLRAENRSGQPSREATATIHVARQNLRQLESICRQLVDKASRPEAAAVALDTLHHAYRLYRKHLRQSGLEPIANVGSGLRYAHDAAQRASDLWTKAELSRQRQDLERRQPVFRKAGAPGQAVAD